MVENKILRKNARQQLGNNIFDKTWLMVMVAYLIYSAIISAASIVAFLLTGPLVYGINRICVNLVRGKRDVQLEDMFAGFNENFVQAFLVSLMTGLFSFLWGLLFIVPGIIKGYAYSMAPYILQDDPTKDWRTCMDESQEMMRGNKWQLFCLDFSFIGWELLGLLCCCVGVIFVTPYQLTARANFYMALKAMNESHTQDGADGQDGDTGENTESEPVDPFAN